MSIAENLQRIQQRILAACQRSGRDAHEVTLIAVSKGHSPTRIREAWDAGLTLFGENKVQELKLKVGQCPGAIQWEFIGHLQTNKCREAAYHARLIHAVDRLKLANALQQAAEKLSKTIPVLLEVNVSGEASKHGFSPAELLEQLDELNQLDRIEIHGLMTMAPWSKDPENARPHFRALNELRGKAEDQLGAPLTELSMGMSGDFEVAIEEGATRLRLGTVLFGQRT